MFVDYHNQGNNRHRATLSTYVKGNKTILGSSKIQGRRSDITRVIIEYASR